MYIIDYGQSYHFIIDTKIGFPTLWLWTRTLICVWYCINCILIVFILSSDMLMLRKWWWSNSYSTTLYHPKQTDTSFYYYYKIHKTNICFKLMLLFVTIKRQFSKPWFTPTWFVCNMTNRIICYLIIWNITLCELWVKEYYPQKVIEHIYISMQTM